MNPKNLETFLRFKKESSKGFYAPVTIEQDKYIGYFVKAYEKIEELTLIAEYSGEVK